MLPPLASLAELEIRAGAQEEAARAGAVLVDASSLIRDEAGKTWVNDLGDLDTVPDMVVTLVLKVAKRAIDNPEGLAGETYPEYAWRKEGAEDGVYLTDKECKIARRLGGRTGLWTQPLTKRSTECDTVFVEDQFGSELFPLYASDDLSSC
jgi:hypothetical protein